MSTRTNHLPDPRRSSMNKSKAVWHIMSLNPTTYEDENKRIDLAHDLRYFGEYRAKHPISQTQGQTIRERPLLRKCIVKYNLTPYPSLEAWDGFSAFCSGKRTFLSEGLKKQLRKMVAEGYFTTPHSASNRSIHTRSHTP